jgi:hypothetical protein
MKMREKGVDTVGKKRKGKCVVNQPDSSAPSHPLRTELLSGVVPPALCARVMIT